MAVRLARWLVFALMAVLFGYVVYVGYEGSAMILAVSKERGLKQFCFTPKMYGGWDYEAVNYDIALDEELPWVDAAGAHNSPHPAYETKCGDLRGTAGNDIVTPDGIRVAAWYIPAAVDIGPTGPTILLVHGNPSNKSDMLRYAQYLHEDFNLLIPDLRNAGRSSGTMSTTGVLEYQEITAVLDWLAETKGPTLVGALGDSGGAAAVLRAAAGGEDRIDAFVTDSAHATQSEVVGHFLQTTAAPRHSRYPALWAIERAYAFRTGHAFDEADPIDTVGSIGGRPYLLLHGTMDDLDHPEVSSELLYDAAVEAGVPVTLQYCEGGKHGQLPRDCAGDYQGWVVPFFTEALAAENG